MGKLIVSEFIAVDGVVEDPGGAEGSDFGGWSMKFTGEGAGQVQVRRAHELRRTAAGPQDLRGLRGGLAHDERPRRVAASASSPRASRRRCSS